MIADLPSPVGLPESVPARPAVLPPTPAVHDVPPPREVKLLSKDELGKLEGDLKELRESQTRRASASPLQDAAIPQAKPTAAKTPKKAKSSAKDKQSSN